MTKKHCKKSSKITHFSRKMGNLGAKTVILKKIIFTNMCYCKLKTHKKSQIQRLKAPGNLVSVEFWQKSERKKSQQIIMHLLYLSLLSIFLQSATLKSSVWRAESAGRLPSSRVFRCGLSCTQPYDRNVQYIQMTTRRKVFSSIFFSIFYDGDKSFFVKQVN